MRNSLIQSLGVHPDLFDVDLESILGPFVIVERRDIHHRIPTDDWHREITYDETYPWIMVWANIHPTEILLPDGDIVIPRPYEFVAINNELVEHRPPRVEGITGRRFIIVKVRKEATWLANPRRNGHWALQLQL